MVLLVIPDPIGVVKTIIKLASSVPSSEWIYITGKLKEQLLYLMKESKTDWFICNNDWKGFIFNRTPASITILHPYGYNSIYCIYIAYNKNTDELYTYRTNKLSN